MSLNNSTIFVTDFPIDTNTSNISQVILTGRYPEFGTVRNTKSEMIIYVLDGRVVLHLENSQDVFEKGQVVLIKTNQEYFWEPKEKVTLLIFSNPPWTSDQQKIEK